MTVLKHLRSTAAQHSVDHVLQIGDRHFTYADLDGGSNAAAQVLRAHGVGFGDRVCLYSRTSIDFILAYLGTLKLGAVAVPANPAYQAAELSRILNDSEPTVIVVDADRLPVATQCAPGSVRSLLRIERGGASELPRTGPGAPGTYCFYEALRKTSVKPVDETVGDDDLALILYTSGTSAESRGAMLTHGNLSANIEALVLAFQWTSQDRFVHALPLFHVHGLCVGLHGALMTGCAAIFLEQFDAEQLLATLEACRATLFMGVPTMYSRMLAAAPGQEFDLTHMRLFISGSAPLPRVVGEGFQQRFGHQILERYGMTESLITVAQPAASSRKPGFVGHPVLGVALRLVNQQGQDVQDGQAGQILVRGASVSPGYWRNEQATRAAFQDGWLLTGDIGRRDPETGELAIVGRQKEIIISGGYNVHPLEVEEALTAHADVIEAAVFGLPDSDLGERVAAALVLREGVRFDEQTLAAHCQERLANYKRPRSFRLVQELPRNSMGKVLKQELK